MRDYRYQKRRRFSRTRLRAAGSVIAVEQLWKNLRLDGRTILETEIVDCMHHLDR
jgi:hypothetical protein